MNASGTDLEVCVNLIPGSASLFPVYLISGSGWKPSGATTVSRDGGVTTQDFINDNIGTCVPEATVNRLRCCTFYGTTFTIGESFAVVIKGDLTYVGEYGARTRSNRTDIGGLCSKRSNLFHEPDCFYNSDLDYRISGCPQVVSE